MARGYSGAFGHKLNAPYVFLPLCAIFLLGLRRLAPLAARRQPRPARPARLRRLPLLLQPGRNRRLGAAPVPGAALPAGPGAVDRLPRQGGGAAAGLAGRLAADRRPLPDGLPGRPQHRRLRRDRRRLRQRRRRRPDRPRRTDLRQLPRRRLRRATPTARSTTTPTSPSSGSGPGREAGTTCPPPTAPRSSSTSLTFGFLILLGHPHPPGTGGPPPGRDPRLRLGRLPLHRLRPGVQLQRHARRDAARRDPAGPCPTLGPRSHDRALATFAKFAPALLAPMLLTYEPRTPPGERRLRARFSLSAPLTGWRGWLLFSAGFAAIAVAVMLWPAIDPGLRTVLRPHDRLPGRAANSPFSIWGQVPSLESLRTAILVAIAALVRVPCLPPAEEVSRPGGCPGSGAADRCSSSPCTTGSTSTSSGSTPSSWWQWRPWRAGPIPLRTACTSRPTGPRTATHFPSEQVE